jgi:hypothetical protein
MLCRTASIDSQSSLQTPPNVTTPSSAATESDLGSTRIRKKVGWSIHTQYKEPPQYRDSLKAYKSSPLSAPSSSLSKPVKGILKPSSSPHVLSPSLDHHLNGSDAQANIAEMLDSTIKQLAGSDRDSKLDAYMMLSRALKSSNNLPDRVALQDKMSLFTQFIQRDVISKNEKGSLDSSLVNHALTLLATFLHFPAIASMLGSDFAIFIIDHSIRSFQQPAVPKDVIRHLMQVVAFQNFSTKVMTADRVGRLVSVLNSIEDHAKGKSIIMGRIQIFKRLVKQSQSHMAAHPDWVKDLLTDMLSTIKDIRSQAINLGLEAAFSLRSDKQFMRKTMEILQTPQEDQTYIQFYIQQLEGMVKDRSTSSAVPQIWSVVTALLRCPLDRWEHYNPWLKLAQSAFNSADVHTKLEANYAWSRYVYLCLLGGKASPKTLGMLCQPLLSQLRRKSSSKPSEDAVKLRRAVIGAVCTLMYYLLKPGDTSYSQDLVWDVVVQPIMTQLSNATVNADLAGDGPMQASRILVGILDSSTPRVWRDDRILDLPLVKPEELPPLDFKWTRKNSAKIFQVIGPILEKKSLDIAKDETLTYRLWQGFAGSVAKASMKDIKVSEETIRFLACSLGVLSRFWTEGIASPDQAAKLKLYSSVRNFVKILLQAFPMRSFPEKRLVMTAPHTFEPAAVPAHGADRAQKSVGDVRSPLHHLLLILSSDAAQATGDDEFTEFYLTFFEPFLHEVPEKSRLELISDFAEQLPRTLPSVTGPWTLTAKHIGSRFDRDDAKPGSKPAPNEQPLGPEYREVVSLLERGLLGNGGPVSQQWINLFNNLSGNILETFGEVGRGLVLVEPLAKHLLENCNTPTQLTEGILQASQLLLEAAKMPQDRQLIEATRNRLWGTPATVKRGLQPDVFENLTKFGNWVLDTLYSRFSDFDAAELIAPLLRSVHAFLDGCFKHNDAACLNKMQTGLCLWIQDDKGHATSDDHAPAVQALENVWDRISEYLGNYQPVDRDFLEGVEPLLAAALTSKHPAIATKAMEAWGGLTQNDEEVDCPSSLRSMVSSLRTKANATPRSGPVSGGGFGAQDASFTEMDVDLSFNASTTSSHQAVPSTSAESKAEALSSSSRRRPVDTTPDVIPTRRSKRNTVSKLRHDDSQIQFAPIPSALPNEESQHLTERQREVRERQKENTTMYAQIQSSSPGHPAGRSTRQSQRNRASASGNEEALTPTRTNMYEELVSSTPTPRRGQLVHLDELNDPPSSPPEPRPYPLLSEIQSRSRGGNSLESWEFSSPPTSPVTSRQQVMDEIEPPHVTLTNDTTQQDARLSKSSFQDIDETEVIPSSFDAEPMTNNGPRRSARSPSARRKLELAKKRPSTPPPQKKKQATLHSKVQETPKSGDDEFVDARSSPDPSSPGLPPLPSQSRSEDPRETAKDSARPADGEVKSSPGIVVELQSRPSESVVTRSSKQSSKRRRKEKTRDECIQVHTDSSPSQRITRAALRRSPTPEIPSTAIEEPVDATTQAQKKRKRGGARSANGRRKRSRSEITEALANSDPAEHVDQEANPATPSEETTPAETAVGVQTRCSLKRQREEEVAPPAAVKEVANKAESVGGDTDEELMSQLVTESQAASQSQSQQDLPDAIEGSMVDADADAEPSSAKRRRSERKQRRDEEQEKVNEKANEIMETLRSGLGVMRDAKLSRENVYEIEDILMDMKRELFQAERRGRRKLGK